MFSRYELGLGHHRDGDRSDAQRLGVNKQTLDKSDTISGGYELGLGHHRDAKCSHHQRLRVNKQTVDESDTTRRNLPYPVHINLQAAAQSREAQYTTAGTVHIISNTRSASDEPNNAAQLEMPILANHGSDTWFAFLHGRWSRWRNVIKAMARLDSAGVLGSRLFLESSHGIFVPPAIIIGITGAMYYVYQS